ncbi:MAG: hypothetical protein ACYS8W_10635 [Planctomycetota bacterium]|jgi:hypothetical protein
MRFLITLIILLGLALVLPSAIADDDPREGETEESGEKAEKGEKKKAGSEEELTPEEKFLRRMREELEKQLEEERKSIEKSEIPGQEEKENPLQKLLKDTLKHMKEAEQYLAKHNPDKPCKIEIDGAQKKLETLIDLAQQQQKMEGQGQSQEEDKKKKPKSGGQKPQQQEPRRDPKQKQGAKPNKSGQRERNDQQSSRYQRKRKLHRMTLKRLEKLRREAEEMKGGEWGNLPAKIREDAMDARADEFPEKYRDIIEKYYDRLSGEKNE